MLQVNGIHFDRRLNVAGLSLEGLSAADFSAPYRYKGIIRHVLGLEGSNAKSLRAEVSAERRRNDTFAHAGTCALNHDLLRGHRLSPSGVFSSVRRQLAMRREGAHSLCECERQSARTVAPSP